MKIRSILFNRISLPVFFALWGLWPDNALAADISGFTRADYDLILRWVNFIILAGLIIKYSRRPLVAFLKDKKNEVARSIEEYEAQKQEADVKIRESEAQLAASQERLELIKERIVSEGQRRKTELIEDAQNESRIMLETAQQKIEGQIREAYERIKFEMIDMATQRALAKLPAVLNPADHERLVRRWIDFADQ